jgi:hypothetical protein
MANGNIDGYVQLARYCQHTAGATIGHARTQASPRHDRKQTSRNATHKDTNTDTDADADADADTDTAPLDPAVPCHRLQSPSASSLAA